MVDIQLLARKLHELINSQPRSPSLAQIETLLREYCPAAVNVPEPSDNSTWAQIAQQMADRIINPPAVGMRDISYCYISDGDGPYRKISARHDDLRAAGYEYDIYVDAWKRVDDPQV